MIFDTRHLQHQLLVPFGERTQFPFQPRKQFVLAADIKPSYLVRQGHGNLRLFCGDFRKPKDTKSRGFRPWRFDPKIGGSTRFRIEKMQRNLGSHSLDQSAKIRDQKEPKSPQNFTIQRFCKRLASFNSSPHIPKSEDSSDQ